MGLSSYFRLGIYWGIPGGNFVTPCPKRRENLKRLKERRKSREMVSRSLADYAACPRLLELGPSVEGGPGFSCQPLVRWCEAPEKEERRRKAPREGCENYRAQSWG